MFWHIIGGFTEKGHIMAMYPDPTTPKAAPEVLMRLDYDPFQLIPEKFPAHPRMLARPDRIARFQKVPSPFPWRDRALGQLVESAKVLEALPESFDIKADRSLNIRILRGVESVALLGLLRRNKAGRERALAGFRWLARAYLGSPVQEANHGAPHDIAETAFCRDAACAYDLLAAEGLSEADDSLFREMFQCMIRVLDANSHRDCGNHGTWSQVGRLAIGSALGDRRIVHDAMYGSMSAGKWRYGLMHAFRHDFLADGWHWERVIGYHVFTLMVMVEAVDILQGLGIDLWHRDWPAAEQNDLNDLHRGYGPPGSRRSLKPMFDVVLYQMMGNGDYSLLSDSRLVNVRGIGIWGVIFNLAYEAYRDPAYAWLLNRLEEDPMPRAVPGFPATLQGNAESVAVSHLDFIRISQPRYPKGTQPWAKTKSLGSCGRHENGISHFPIQGSAVLRSRPSQIQTPSAFLFWGPHSAGHQSPAALHLDVHDGVRPITTAPTMCGGYENSQHLRWIRTTVAHNTVTVDEKSMFPYDFDDPSIWEADTYRDSVSDGEGLGTGLCGVARFVRARNDRVYPGVRLDRTVLLTDDYLVDVYRVISAKAHRYNWAMHCLGVPELSGGKPLSTLGKGRGYDQISRPVRLSSAGRIQVLDWRLEKRHRRWVLWTPPGREICVGVDPSYAQAQLLGHTAPLPPVFSVVAREKSKEAVFVSLCSWRQGADLRLEVVGRAQAQGDLSVRVFGKQTGIVWKFPYEGEIQCVSPQRRR
jgi:hypothetical protein